MTYSEKHILDHILKLTKRFISIPSTEDNPTALSEVLEVAKKELQGYFPMEEFESKGIPSILVHNTNKRTKHFKIILNGHLDVVPGKKDQFQTKIKNGKLYGRGAYDMKAAAAVMIVLFRNLAQEISYPLALQIVTDEENYSEHTTQYQIKKGIRGEFVICGESSSNLNIRNAAKGSLWINIEASGKTAHGGYLWRGDNALWKLSDVLHKIREIYPVPQEEIWATTINLAKIETPNIAANAVPDKAIAYLDIRFIHEDRDILTKIKSLIPDDMKIHIIQDTIPTYVSPDNSFVTLLGQEIKKISPEDGQIQNTHATSDIRFYNEVDCMGIEFGPKGGNPHSENEYVDIQSLLDYYHILKNFLLSAPKL
ncbi:MAG TPA: M20/M25/M40 family metallo-hydrolase [Candidatus Saccharimonadales bacterium]|nr:M20/M25/M40 family metallo-hydrolase [Candidatus Saccharimonadales bacterium]